MSGPAIPSTGKALMKRHKALVCFTPQQSVKKLKFGFIIFEAFNDEWKHAVVYEVWVFDEEQLDREIGWLPEFDVVDCSGARANCN